jgi:hypothetical protein
MNRVGVPRAPLARALSAHHFQYRIVGFSRAGRRRPVRAMAWPLAGSNQYRAEVSTARSMVLPRRTLDLGLTLAVHRLSALLVM